MTALNLQVQAAFIKVSLLLRPLQHPHLIVLQLPSNNCLELLPRDLLVRLLRLRDRVPRLEARLHADVQRCVGRQGGGVAAELRRCCCGGGGEVGRVRCLEGECWESARGWGRGWGDGDCEEGFGGRDCGRGCGGDALF